MNIFNIVAGFLTGVAASMGLGGGFILIIWLTSFAGIGQKEAGGINLLFFLPVALLSIIIHTKNNLIEWKIIPTCCIAGTFGVGAGFLILKLIDEDPLQKIFAVLLIAVGLKELLHKKLDISKNLG
ncbi:MAG: sulfite exporter TauE/SafE family protein [Eubacterium sp.]|jgi:uncharacterized membrane protein YfcA|nr:sulfite exporter TauE/SafE family protein [Eubacterium sp.]